MKHIFTFFLFALTVAATAQNLQIRSAAGTVIDGQTFLHTGSQGDFEIVAEGYFLHNIGSTSIAVRCKRDEMIVVPNTGTALCWAACSPDYLAGASPTLVAPAGAITMAPGDSLDLFKLHFYPHNTPGYNLYKVTFYNSSIAADTVIFYHEFDIATSVTENVAKPISINAYPNPANSFINIDVANFNEIATLRIVDALGITVKLAQINGESNLKFSTGDLRQGVYFYSLISNNKTILTRRLVITR